MLDEKKEFDALLNFNNKINFEKTIKLKRKTKTETKSREILLCSNLEESLSGIGRALTILARGFLFDENVLEWKKETRIKCCEAFLKHWFRNTPIDEALYDSINDEAFDKNIFHSFIRPETFAVYVKSLEASSKKSHINICHNYKDSTLLKRGIFTNASSFDNRRNAISAETIIADALFQGPLKTHILVAKENVLKSNEIKTRNVSKDGSVTLENASELNRKFLLCAVAIYLKAKALTVNCPQQKYIPFKQVDLANFRNIGCDNIRKQMKKFIYISESQNIIELCTIGGSRSKLSINEAFIKDFDIKLLNDAETAENGYEVFTDFDLIKNTNK